MFQLIVAVISIALVAALAIASIYYGGTAFSKSSLRANVVTLVNGGQQIAGAQALYRTDKGADAPSIEALSVQPSAAGEVSYLTQIPGVSPIASGTWSIIEPVAGAGFYASVPLNSTGLADVTAEVNRQATGNTAVAGNQFFVSGSTFRFKL